MENNESEITNEKVNDFIAEESNIEINLILEEPLNLVAISESERISNEELEKEETRETNPDFWKEPLLQENNEDLIQVSIPLSSLSDNSSLIKEQEQEQDSIFELSSSESMVENENTEINENENLLDSEFQKLERKEHVELENKHSEPLSIEKDVNNENTNIESLNTPTVTIVENQKKSIWDFLKFRCC